MKKKYLFVSLFFIVSTSVMAITNSIVPLSGGGDVAAGQSVSIPLTDVLPSVTYDVVCYIENTFPFNSVKLSSTLGGVGGSITSYSLNGSNVAQGQLDLGRNVALIRGNFPNPALSNIIFTNLDKTNLFNVNNCFAMAVIG